MDNRKAFETEFHKLNRLVAAEGIVLLKNNNSTLPILDTDKVSLFGRCQIDYYRSGTGSGGAVNTEYSVNAIDGLKKANVSINKELLSLYEDYIHKNPFNKGNGQWGSEPWSQKEMVLDDSIVEEASKKSNKAIIFIGRTAGEDKDHYIGKGSLLLTDKEIHMIDLVTKYFKEIILIYNVGNVIDMSCLEKYDNKINSILYAWQGGMDGGDALADILTGKVSPSGKLPDTIAKNIHDYQTNKNFGNPDENYYEEDIYVGYRYFETFAKDKVLYPFGHGLSYTDFSITTRLFKKDNKNIYIDLTIKNIGETKGKEVIQIYSEAPQGKLGKPFVELVGFQKTKLLQPNETEQVSFVIPLYNLSSYDDSGETNYKSSYILESGKYNIYCGKNSRNISLISSFSLEETVLIETLKEALAPIKEFSRIKPGSRLSNNEYEESHSNVSIRSVNLEERIKLSFPKEIVPSNKKCDFKDVINNSISLDDFIASLSKEQLSLIVLGEGMSHPLVTSGTAAAFGGLYPELSEIDVPAACAADGPSGLRMDNGATSIQMPIGTLIASTWNTSLVKDLYTLEGQELSMKNVDTLLGPGMNIHRNPMCGRNFEYFSEDPLLTGRIASAIVKGIRKGGSEATLKHFAANDQEAHRFDVDSIASERCLREIHLKAFEIAVKESNPKSIMTAYNPINGHHSASNYDLNTEILRNEWGFKGLVMTDWWAKMNHNSNPDKAEKFRVAEMIKSQNDLYMVIPNWETKGSLHYKELLKHLESGYLSLGELQRSVKNILTFILNSKAINRPVQKEEIKHFVPLENKNIESNNLNSIINFNSLNNPSKFIKTSNYGSYNLVVKMKNEGADLSQSACNILINNQLLTNIQLNGNNPQTITKTICKVFLQKGLYEISLEYIKPGLEIIEIEFKLI